MSAEAVSKSRLASWAVDALATAAFGAALLVCRLFPPRRGRSWAPTGRILVIGTFYNTNWFLSHARPLAQSGVTEVIVVADEPQPTVERVSFAGPPRWVSRVLGRQIAKLLWAWAAGLRRRPDLYMGFHIVPNALTALVLGRLFDRPTCYQMTGGPLEIVGGGHDSENQFLNRLRRASPRLERLALAAAASFDLVVVRGESARRFLKERGVTARTVIIPGSVDPQRQPASEERRFDLIFVGRLTETKQPLQFLEIVADVARSIPTLRALVVGDGPLMEAARRHAEHLALADRLEFAGRRSDVEELLVRSRVFVLTSRSEGLSIAMAEAMSAGVVPVVSDVGELGELVSDGVNGYLVAPGDQAQYVARILGLLQDPDLWQRLSPAAADTARAQVGLARVSELWARALSETVGSFAGGESHRVLEDRAAVTASVASERRVPVMLLVSSLEVGGAERQVVELARCLDPARFDLSICSLGTAVPLAESLPDLERRLVIVPKRWRFDATTIPRVARAMSRARVQIVQSFLFDADLVARCAARLAGAPVVIGSERNSDYRRPALQRLSLRLTRRWVDAVIANSEAGRRFTVRTLGMAEADVYAVPNGVDLERFRPRDPAPARAALGLPARGPVVGMLASFKPQKNHLMFLEVAQRVSARFPDAIFVCAGEPLGRPAGAPRWLRAGTGLHHDVEGYHQRVARAIEERGLADRCRLLGRVAAVEQVYNACDLTVLTSLHEGTPNVLLESMASGVPVVATAVADNAELVPDGRVGHVVPPGDAAAMAARVEELLGDEGRRRALGTAARSWAEREFSSAALAARTATVYEELLRRKSRRSKRQAAPLPSSGRGALARGARGRAEDAPARSRSGNSRV